MTIENTILEIIKSRSKSNPIKNIDLRERVFVIHGVRLSERTIKAYVKTFRDNALPVLASREKPFGYFYAQEISELADYEKTFRAQAMSELTTLKNMKVNYKRLCGQKPLAFV